MTYIARRIQRITGKPVAGPGDTLVREYSSDSLARKHMLKHLAPQRFSPGQYQITESGRHVGFINKF